MGAFNHGRIIAACDYPPCQVEKAMDGGRGLFRRFAIPSPYQDLKDVFRLKDKRVVDAYRKISWEGVELRVPNGIPKETVDLKIVPDNGKGLVGIRLWQDKRFLGNLTIPMEQVQNVYF